MALSTQCELCGGCLALPLYQFGLALVRPTTGWCWETHQPQDALPQAPDMPHKVCLGLQRWEVGWVLQLQQTTFHHINHSCPPKAASLQGLVLGEGGDQT